MTAVALDAAIEARYRQDDHAARLGNLASTLARAARGAQAASRFAATDRVLLEGSLFAAWSAELAGSPDLRDSLLRLNAALSRLHSQWGATGQWEPKLAPEVAARCREYSQQALEWSGLLDDVEAS